MYSIEKLFMNICMDFWASDVSISYERFREEILERINNIKSHMGLEAHAREEALGVIDETGMSIEEHDAQDQQLINDYQALLDFLDDDSNWIN